MIKIDYEGAWKELREEYGDYLIDCQDMEDIWVRKAMNKIVQKHTHNDHYRDTDVEESFHIVMIWKRIKDGYQYKWDDYWGKKRIEEYRKKFLGQEVFRYDGEDVKIIEFNLSFP